MSKVTRRTKAEAASKGPLAVYIRKRPLPLIGVIVVAFAVQRVLFHVLGQFFQR